MEEWKNGRMEEWKDGRAEGGRVGFGVRSEERWALRVASHGPHHRLDTEPKFIPNFALSAPLW